MANPKPQHDAASDLVSSLREMGRLLMGVPGRAWRGWSFGYSHTRRGHTLSKPTITKRGARIICSCGEDVWL